MKKDNTYLINYTIHKLCPYFSIAFLMFYNSNFSPLRAFICLGLAFFIDRYSFRAGWAVAYCESNNIPLEDD